MKEIGQVAYEAYTEHCGGKSVHGEDLPDWHGQSHVIQGHWNAAGQAVSDVIHTLPGGEPMPS